MAAYCTSTDLNCLGVYRRVCVCVCSDDHDVNGLRVCAYAAVSAVVTGGAEDTIEQSVALVPGLLERLSQSLKTPCPMPSAAQEQQGLQLHLASLLQCIAQKAGANIKPHAPSIMEALIQVSLVEGSAATEDAILAMGSIAQGMPYMHKTRRFTAQQWCAEGARAHACMCTSFG